MPPKAAIIQPILMAGVMAFLMTALITWLNLGLPPDYLARWMTAFVIAWPAAAVAAYIAIPLARRATGHIVGWLEAKGF
jgi:predicted PurR-regulated permease PerM